MINMSSLKKNNLSSKCYDSSARKKPKDEKDEDIIRIK